MNAFDVSILHFFGRLSHRSQTLDSLIVWTMWSNFFKGGVVMALFWWAWARRAHERLHQGEAREYLLVGFGLSIFAIAVARILA